ncbi:sulfite exporter TauE/SafE family protein [Deinococcus malanensis]|nr:sulfite exporter TauE/SafE family protein [Deinococcus malanensis]
MKPLREWWRAGPAPYLLGGMTGVPAGLWMLYNLPGVTLTVTFGAFLCVYALYSIFKPDTLALTLPSGPAAAVSVGALGGVIGGFTAFPGAVVVVWAGLTRLSKADTRAVVQPYILGMQLLSLTVLAVTQPWTFGPSFWHLGVLALPFVLGCTLMGLRLYCQLSDFNFRRVTFLLLGSSGIGILIKSLPAF